MAGRLKLIVASLSAFCLISGALIAQTRRLVVVKPNDAELRRTAAHYNMCPERLQAVRQLLEEAAELFPAAKAPNSLGFMLFQFDRPKAEEIVISLVEELRSKARQATDRQEYQRVSGSAMELIRSLERTNPSLAEKLEDDWPEDSTPQVAQGAQPGSAPFDYLGQQEFLRKAQRHPEEALRQLDTVPPSSYYMARSTLLNGLLEKGMDAEARQLLDQTLATPAAALSPAMISQFGQFTRTALMMFPDYSERIQNAIASAYQGLAQSGDPSTRPYPLPNGQTLQVSQADLFLLSQLASGMNSDPQFTARLIELSPNISQKVKAAGGYSAFFRGNMREWRQSQRALRDMTEDQLESKFADASASELLRSTGQLCYDFPEKAEKIYDVALRKIEAETDLAKAANDFDNLGSRCARCLGELPDRWMASGKDLLQKLRKKEAETTAASNSPDSPVGMRYPGQSSTFRLESLLIAFKADTDFAGALQDAHAIEDKSSRFEVLMRMAQHLSNR